MRYSRCRTLFGDEDFAKLQKAKVLILGVGGVGSYALDCLYKSGVTNITILDYDTYDESNLNRQIGAEGNIGKSKVATPCQTIPKHNPNRAKNGFSMARELRL